MTALNVSQAHAKTAQLLQAGNLVEAAAVCHQILTASPADHVALHNLGVIAARTGNLEQSVNLMRRAIGIEPRSADYQFNISQPLMALGRHAEAEAALREAARLDPKMSSARVNLGAALAQQNKLPEAEQAFRAAIALRPNDAALYVNLGRVCRWQEKPQVSIDCYRKAIAIDPGFAPSYSALGSCLRELGRIGEAVSAFRKAVEVKPDFREAHSNLVYALHFDPDTTPEGNYAEHLRWAVKFAQPLAATIQPHANDRSPRRRLRIGYVSPDLVNHPVGVFMEPILEEHDKASFEVFCYADAQPPDDMTQRMQRHASVWRPTSGMSDEQLAQLIRKDRIDVLIDLTLHMRRSRLAMFARKPAPVQITHLAYCATSGLKTMDWCITDPHMSPPGLHEKWFTEKLLRLAESYWCYRPSPGSPAVGPLPAASRGFITFGSFNTFAKINHRVITLWKEVLDAVPNSRLAVHATNGDANTEARKMFTDRGIAPDRLSLFGRTHRDEYFNLYNGVDIALDPFPYGGGTTSLDALWMGVPLVTLAGVTALSRTGITLLSNIGMPELIANNPRQYVEIAAKLGGDIGGLAAMRRQLRSKLQSSVLMDAPRYTRNLEAAYRSAWTNWCHQRMEKV